jgi:aldehyde:ferredoxin oxidoreductase
MLLNYYSRRGWDLNGVPKKETLERLSLQGVAHQLGF